LPRAGTPADEWARPTVIHKLVPFLQSLRAC